MSSLKMARYPQTDGSGFAARYLRLTFKSTHSVGQNRSKSMQTNTPNTEPETVQSPAESPTELGATPCSSLAERVAACLRPRSLTTILAERFWKEDNATSNFSEPPSMVYEAVEKALSEVLPTREKIEILEREMECAWGLIANAGTSLGHWETMPQEWQDCAARWRDRYFGKTNDKFSDADRRSL